MGRLRAASIVCALVLVAALGLSACGGGSSDLLPEKTAEQLNRNLDEVRARIDQGDCVGAEDAVGEVSEEVEGLGGVDKELKAALRQGTDRLDEMVSSCADEALEEDEAEREAEEKAEQAEQEAVEAQEQEFEAGQEQEEEAKKEKKLEKDEEKEEQKTEREEESESVEPPESAGEGEGEEKGKGPPAETPSGNEPPAGGVGPGTEVE